MQWWNDLISWLTSSAARPTVYAGIVLFVAVLAAGLLAAWIASAAIRRVVAQRDRESKTAAIAALVDAATEASVWNSLTPQEQVLADRAVGQADILVRLLPIRGSDVAAELGGAPTARAQARIGHVRLPARPRRRRVPRPPDRVAAASVAHAASSSRTTSCAGARNGRSPSRSRCEEQDTWIAEQHHERYQSAATLDTAPPGTDTAPTQTLDDARA